MYSLWVCGNEITTHLVTRNKAKYLKKLWMRLGYDDVVIMKVGGVRPMATIEHYKNEKSDSREYGIVFSYAKVAIYIGRHDFYIDFSAPNKNIKIIREYLSRHDKEEHNYLSADDTESGDYDVCMECDCVRHIYSTEWKVGR